VCPGVEVTLRQGTSYEAMTTAESPFLIELLLQGDGLDPEAAYEAVKEALSEGSTVLPVYRGNYSGNILDITENRGQGRIIDWLFRIYPETQKARSV